MKKGWIETRRRMLKERMNDAEYLETSYVRAKRARLKRYAEMDVQ